MRTELNNPVDYYLELGDHTLHVNDWLGKRIQLIYHHQINCIKCGTKTVKSFGQGFCFPCFKTAPEADPGIFHPELDQAHLGISRDMEWAKQNSLQPHYVYLAISSNLKVGVTRATQVPTRWIDQGAWQAIKLAETPYRELAGQIEVQLKRYYKDKTNWRKMLKNELDVGTDLEEEKQNAWSYLSEELQQYVIDDDEITVIEYPVSHYPSSVKSVGFDKLPTVAGELIGIKGQYLLFEDSQVFNVRKHNGYKVTIQIDDL